jgi:hypothetical protein
MNEPSDVFQGTLISKPKLFEATDHDEIDLFQKFAKSRKL